MTRFIDGPAAEKTLMLRRAPVFLRVADNGTEFDALDQIDDVPRPNERLYAYVMHEYRGAVHLLIRGKNRNQGGFYMSADYEYLAEQPSDADMRTNSKWRAWTESNKHLIPEAIRERSAK